MSPENILTKVKVDIADTSNYSKLIAGDNITIMEVSGEGDKYFEISGSDTDEKVKVDSEDTQAGYLEDKITAGDNITITEKTGTEGKYLEISASGGSDKKITISEKTSSYTLTLNDAYSLIDMNSESETILTIPASSSVNFDIGTYILVRQKGTGAVKIEGAEGVSINAYSTNYYLAGQYAMAVIIKVDTDTWELEGNLQPET